MRRLAGLVWGIGWMVCGAAGLLAADDVNTTLTDALTQSSPTSRYSSGLGVAAQQLFGPAATTDTTSAAYETLTPGSYYYTEEPATGESKKGSTLDAEPSAGARTDSASRRTAPKPRPQNFRYDELQP